MQRDRFRHKTRHLRRHEPGARQRCSDRTVSEEDPVVLGFRFCQHCVLDHRGGHKGCGGDEGTNGGVDGGGQVGEGVPGGQPNGGDQGGHHQGGREITELSSKYFSRPSTPR